MVWRTAVKAAVETHLRHEPAKVNKSRIEELRNLRQPQYRLRVDTIGVYSDTEGDHGKVPGIAPKDLGGERQAQFGEPL